MKKALALLFTLVSVIYFPVTADAMQYEEEVTTESVDPVLVTDRYFSWSGSSTKFSSVPIRQVRSRVTYKCTRAQRDSYNWRYSSSSTSTVKSTTISHGLDVNALNYSEYGSTEDKNGDFCSSSQPNSYTNVDKYNIEYHNGSGWKSVPSYMRSGNKIKNPHYYEAVYDTESPTILGIPEINYIELGGTLPNLLEGTYATDDIDKDHIVVFVEHEINLNKAGLYTVTYRATDKFDHVSTITKSVEVVDTTAPRVDKLKDVIKLSSQNMDVDYNEYFDIENLKDIKTITNNIEEVVNQNKSGLYDVTFVFTDDAGNKTTHIVKVDFTFIEDDSNNLTLSKVIDNAAVKVSSSLTVVGSLAFYISKRLI